MPDIHDAVETTLTGAVELDSVGYAYRMRGHVVPVLEGLSFEVAPGEHVCLLGESGSGKSTVLDLVAALRLPDRGQVRVLGTVTSSLSLRQRADLRLRHVAHIYQDFRLFPMMTAVDNVAVVPRLRGASRSEAVDRAAVALEQVGLRHRLGHRPDELSGGEQQRVAIARALVTEAAIVLADEPTGALDAGLRTEVLDLMDATLRDAARIVVTHDPVVADHASRVIVLPRTGVDAASERA